MNSTIAAILANAPPAPAIKRIAAPDPRTISDVTRARLIDLHVHFSDPWNRPLSKN